MSPSTTRSTQTPRKPRSTGSAQARSSQPRSDRPRNRPSARNDQPRRQAEPAEAEPLVATVPTGPVVTSFAELGVPPRSSPCLASQGILDGVPDPVGDPAGLARRPRRARPRPHRLRQDHRLRAAARGAPRRVAAAALRPGHPRALVLAADP